ncbi:MAG: RelA/SpoT family protein [Bacteroidales bacterium]|nr:RelA/SpoT family protein [Bacteroidales bacterium]
MSISFQEKEALDKTFEDLLNVCHRCKNEEDRQKIRKAYEIAFKAHENMRRKSGEPYLYHPLAVARIAAEEIGLGATSVICALLHDVVEDSDYTLEEIRQMFGEKVANIIDGLTKISNVFDQGTQSIQAENFRKMLLTLSDDVRVILLKLADRLHNMRTLDAVPEYKKMKVVAETLYLYAPLAHRLGLYKIKTELEDLSLKHQHPVVYNEILRKLEASEEERQIYIKQFCEPIEAQLQAHGIKYQISGRPKSVYSIWNKMQTKGIPFEEVYDIFAIRIIFDPTAGMSEKAQCWAIYSIVTDIYKPKPDRLRDWISTPKANGYEALHTTVMGHQGRWVEVQIRSRRMDEIAELGYAAHWKYKDGGEESELDKWIKKIREMLENNAEDALEFIDEFKMNLFSSEIFVFTPKGLLKRLPKGSTALDFAYDIHSEIGNHAIGAKVNFKLVPLNHVLNSGDQVEILTSEIQSPQKEWLDFVITAKAKSKIREHFKNERRNYIVKGKGLLEEKFKEWNIPLNSKTLKQLLVEYRVNTKDDLYYKMGAEEPDWNRIKKIVQHRSRNKFIRYWRIQISKTTSKLPFIRSAESNRNDQFEKAVPIDRKKTLVLGEDTDLHSYSIAQCCKPIPGDPVIGYLVAPSKVVIHKKECEQAIRYMANFGDRIVTLEWVSKKILSYIVRIKITGVDNIGVVHNITNLLSNEMEINMKSILFDASHGIFTGIIDLYIHDAYDLSELINKIKRLKGVHSVKRIEIPENDTVFQDALQNI